MSLIKNTLSQSAFWKVNKYLAREFGDNDCALLLSDFVSKQEYFASENKLDDDGFFFNTREKIKEDTNISPDMQRKYISILESYQVLQTKTGGLPKKTWYKVNELAIINLLHGNNKSLDFAPTGDSEIQRLETGFPDDIYNKNKANKNKEEEKNNIGVAVHSDDSIDEQQPHPKRVKIKEPSIEPKNESVKESTTEKLKSIFDEFRKSYPGTKGGLNIEWENFTKKNKKEYHLIVPILKEAVERELKHKQQQRENKQFTPSWKNLSTWINNKCWEQEFGKIEASEAQVNGSRNNYPNTNTSEGASGDNASERKFDNIFSMMNNSII